MQYTDDDNRTAKRVVWISKSYVALSLPTDNLHI